jgi:hypothetical protein
MPPKKKNRPKVTPGQVRGIVREMGQPPFNARKRTRVSQKGLVARTRKQEAPKAFTPVQRKFVGAPGRPGYVSPEEKIQRLKETMGPRAKRAVTPTAKPKVQKPLKSRTVTTRAGAKPRLKATGPALRKRIIGIDLRTLPDLVRRGVVSQSEANTIARGVERRAYNIPVQGSGRGPSDSILRREMNMTPMARARLDAEEARLAREAQLSANKQYEESRRNPRVQNPMREPSARRIVEQQVIQADKAIKKAEKEKARRQKKPLRPRGGMLLPPLMGGGGGGAMPRIK